MTPKEAIDNISEIQCIITDTVPACDPEDNWGRYTIALNIAKKALEKQIEKKPIIYTDTRNLLDYNGNDYGVREVDVYDCPNCGFDISDKSVCEEYEYKPSCCPECGQKLNWEDWSEEE